MKKFLLITALLFTIKAAIAQTNSSDIPKKQKIYLAIIKKMDGTKIKGWFYKMNDSAIYLLPTSIKKLSSPEYKKSNLNDQAKSINISSINTIAFQRKNAALHGALIGLGAGLVTGVTAGFISGDDPVTPYSGDPFADIFIALGNSFAMTAGEKALAGGITLAGIGSLTGFIVGKIAKKKFIIGGNQQKYQDLQTEFLKRVIVK